MPPKAEENISSISLLKNPRTDNTKDHRIVGKVVNSIPFKRITISKKKFLDMERAMKALPNTIAF